jgi:hypothetical protein
MSTCSTDPHCRQHLAGLTPSAGVSAVLDCTPAPVQSMQQPASVSNYIDYQPLNNPGLNIPMLNYISPLAQKHPSSNCPQRARLPPNGDLRGHLGTRSLHGQLGATRSTKRSGPPARRRPRSTTTRKAVIPHLDLQRTLTLVSAFGLVLW